ncbi:hypothetical protein CYMTET_47063 [Cymbomonas tetramitiformis]|uniref:Uncharacterized protein n=1 Tax=Cymbomonas tetramitiformis TaxID=36881 RepID=A0AAE0BWH8_9CHLO|nr:hypothetical protein CYMTET_47063 [Cymbomonas tetramitiformis]
MNAVALNPVMNGVIAVTVAMVVNFLPLPATFREEVVAVSETVNGKTEKTHENQDALLHLTVLRLGALPLRHLFDSDPHDLTGTLATKNVFVVSVTSLELTNRFQFEIVLPLIKMGKAGAVNDDLLKMTKIRLGLPVDAGVYEKGKGKETGPSLAEKAILMAQQQAAESSERQAAQNTALMKTMAGLVVNLTKNINPPATAAPTTGAGPSSAPEGPKTPKNSPAEKTETAVETKWGDMAYSDSDDGEFIEPEEETKDTETVDTESEVAIEPAPKSPKTAGGKRITCTGDLRKKQVYDKMVFALAKFMMGDFQENAAAAENA